MEVGGAGGHCTPFHLVRDSVLQQPGKGWGGTRWGVGGGGPVPTPSLAAGLTLDKQLQSIYLRPYGVGEQVCR